MNRCVLFIIIVLIVMFLPVFIIVNYKMNDDKCDLNKNLNKIDRIVVCDSSKYINAYCADDYLKVVSDKEKIDSFKNLYYDIKNDKVDFVNYSLGKYDLYFLDKNNNELFNIKNIPVYYNLNYCGESKYYGNSYNKQLLELLDLE